MGSKQRKSGEMLNFAALSLLQIPSLIYSGSEFGITLTCCDGVAIVMKVILAFSGWPHYKISDGTEN